MGRDRIFEDAKKEEASWLSLKKIKQQRSGHLYGEAPRGGVLGPSHSISALSSTQFLVFLLN